jgi:hypothetical protein
MNRNEKVNIMIMIEAPVVLNEKGFFDFFGNYTDSVRTSGEVKRGKIRKSEVICKLVFFIDANLQYIFYKNQILFKIVKIQQNLFFKTKKAILKVKITFFVLWCRRIGFRNSKNAIRNG